MRLVPVDLPSLMMLCGDARPDEMAQYQALTGRPWQRDAVAVDYFTRSGESFLLIDAAGNPVAAAGWEPIGRGVWQAWMVGTLDGWGKHWRSITKLCRMVMEHMLANGERRLQLCCLQSRYNARAWYARGLKMHHEGDMTQFGAGGETASLYARVRAD